MLFIVCWSRISVFVNIRFCRILNSILLFFNIVTVIYITVLSRISGNYDVVLTPFNFLIEARVQPELYRMFL